MTHHCPRSNWTGPESELRRGICPKCAETTLYEDCQARSATITILTHAPGCTYPSGGKRCTCRWTEEQLEELVRGARTETDRAMWAALLREVRK